MNVAVKRIWKTGELCLIKCGGRTVEGRIELASTNGVSLFLCFDAILDPGGSQGGYAGGMAIMWNGRDFQDLAGRGIVELGEVLHSPGGEPPQ
jgi:hypothetical protein